METVRKKLHMLIATATIACIPFGAIHAMRPLDIKKKFQLLGTDETFSQLNKIVQGATNAKLKLSQKTRLPTIGNYVNSIGPYTLTAISGGFLAKKMFWDRKISVSDLLLTVAGTGSSFFWWTFKANAQKQLEKKGKNAQDHYDKTFENLIEIFGKIVGTENQQTRTRKNKTQKSTSTPPKRYALRDLPTKVTREELYAIMAQKEIQKLSKVYQKLVPFKQEFGKDLECLKNFIERNTPGNRNSIIVSDGADNTDEEKVWKTEDGEKDDDEK